MATILELSQFARAAYGGAIPNPSDWKLISEMDNPDLH